MTIELSRPVDKKLRAGVTGFEIELSDSVIDDLLSAIAERLRDDSDDSAASLLLLALDTVARHVDALRVRSNPRAFVLINQLWEVYEHILTKEPEEKQRMVLASAEVKHVLDWQQQCYIDSVNGHSKNMVVRNRLPPSVAELVQQQIAETGRMVQQEMVALKELAGGKSFEAFNKAELDRQISSSIAVQVNSLQLLLSREISKLRKELLPDSVIE